MAQRADRVRQAIGSVILELPDIGVAVRKIHQVAGSVIGPANLIRCRVDGVDEIATAVPDLGSLFQSSICGARLASVSVVGEPDRPLQGIGD